MPKAHPGQEAMTPKALKVPFSTGSPQKDKALFLLSHVTLRWIVDLTTSEQALCYVLLALTGQTPSKQHRFSIYGLLRIDMQDKN